MAQPLACSTIIVSYSVGESPYFEFRWYLRRVAGFTGALFWHSTHPLVDLYRLVPPQLRQGLPV
jgi:hypothetical protein